MKKRKGLTLSQRRDRIGYVFILPWIIGFIFLFMVPAVQSLMYSFSNVNVTANGMKLDFIGFDNFIKAFTQDAEFPRELVNSIGTMIYEVPIIAFFSMFIAGMLNQKFKGRTAARILFFLPVIIASGATIEILTQGGMSTSVSGGTSIYMSYDNALFDMLMNAGFNMQLVDYLTAIVSKIFDITWKSGIQILLYLSALQGIPSSYYEVSSLEGATAWEEFWKITFPLLSPMTLVCVIYSIIDSFTDYQNTVMQLVDKSYKALNYGYSAAQAWVYFLLIFIIIGLVNKLIFRNTVYTEE